MSWHNTEAKGCGSGKRNKFAAVHAGIFGGGIVGCVGLLRVRMGLNLLFHTAVIVNIKIEYECSEFFKSNIIKVNTHC
jgi:hypothetical protein